MKTRPWLLPTVLGVASLPLYGVGFELVADTHPSLVYPWLYYPLLLLSLAAAWWVWRHPGVSPALIVGFAVAFRLLAVGDPPSLSSDVHRYAWDGRVQRAGLSPYAHPPEAPELAALRDAEIHPRINRPWARTVYPPGGQLLYRVLPFDITAVRGVMVAFDVLTMLLLIGLLSGLGQDPARVVLYAWSPFVVYEVANNGHLEAAMLPLLVGAVWALRRGRHRLVGGLWGLATAMKLYPALAGAALSRSWRTLVPACLVFAGLYAVYAWPVGWKVLGFLPEYVGVAEDHNIGLRRVLEWGLSPVLAEPRPVAFGLCVLLLIAGTTWVWRRGGPPERILMEVAGVYLLTLPTALHPWYALWLVPWLCFHPRASWLWLIAALPLSYLKYADPEGLMPGWVVPLELLPVGGLLVFEAWRAR